MKSCVLLLLLCLSVGALPNPPTSTGIARCQFGAQADFFVAYLGESPGVYTRAFCNQVPQVTITGLVQGKTYYIAMSAFVNAKETSKSKESRFVVPLQSPKASGSSGL